MKKLNEIDQMAEEHWEYVERVIEWTLKLKDASEEEIERTIDFARNIYIPAMVHGYKHALQDFQLSETEKGEENKK